MINIVIIAEKLNLSELEKHLGAEKDITVLYATDNIPSANSYLKRAQVIVVDLEQRSTESAITQLKPLNIPIVAVSHTATTGFALLEIGAAEMHLRSSSQTAGYSCRLLAGKIRAVAGKEGGRSARILKRPEISRITDSDKIIVIGSSTGGTDTVEYILKRLPDDAPPILLVQHMPPIFTRMFAERLNNTCRMSVWEAKDGDSLSRGLVLIAPGDRHMVIAKGGSGLIVKCITGERVCNQRPAVDVLFDSVANTLNAECKRVIGVILTGMGSDGANGLLALRHKGAATIGQDESSCVVYGMPKAAYDRGAVQKQLHLNEIASEIMKLIK